MFSEPFFQSQKFEDYLGDDHDLMENLFKHSQRPRQPGSGQSLSFNTGTSYECAINRKEINRNGSPAVVLIDEMDGIIRDCVD